MASPETASLRRVRERLPSLYRPEAGATGLVTGYLAAVAAELDEVQALATQVLQTHWIRFADRASLHPHLIRSRELAGQTTPGPRDALELADPAALVRRLNRANDPVTLHVRKKLSKATAAQLAQAPDEGTPPAGLQRALVADLGRLVAGESLYSEKRFTGVELSAATKERLAGELSPRETARLNLRLLEEAFPGQIVAPRLDHPWVLDLARLAALLPLPPWEQPPALRETAEAFRLRIQRTVELYRGGLATPVAMRRIVEIQLPRGGADLPPEQRDRAFQIEERVPTVALSLQARARGAPEAIVAPLTRWPVSNRGLRAAPVTVYVQSPQPVPGEVDSSERPLIERYAGGGSRPRLGLAFTGKVAAGKTLRLRPAFASWLGRSNHLERSLSRPDDETPADPTAAGPWRRAEGSPEGAIVALRQSADRALWAAVEAVAGGELWRFDGRAWSRVLEDLKSPRCLEEQGADLLLGSDDGLLRVAIFPPSAGAFSASPQAGLEGRAVHALLGATDGSYLAGTDRGIFELPANGPARPFGLRHDKGTGTAIRAAWRDSSGALLFGGDPGLLMYRPDDGAWFAWIGGGASEEDEEWRRLDLDGDGDPRALPKPPEVFLPPVRALLRGPDASLWLGTAHGLARYRAVEERGALRTRLEAFPDLTTGPVFQIALDERGVVWFGTDRGLLRFDGRDLWQHRSAGWTQLGAADSLYEAAAAARGAWRFDRDSERWQRLVGRTWQRAAPALRTTGQRPVRSILWTDGVETDLGQWDGSEFTAESGVGAARLRLRVKPDDRDVRDGGLAAVPRLPTGRSQWRYLALEPEELVEAPTDKRPAWTIEGRLLPPPGADEDAPWPGRYTSPPPSSEYGAAVFAFRPAARVWMAWRERHGLTVLVRLRRRPGEEALDPAVVDRVWRGMQTVRPAGVRAQLAVEEQIVRGDEDDDLS